MGPSIEGVLDTETDVDPELVIKGGVPLMLGEVMGVRVVMWVSVGMEVKESAALALPKRAED